MSKKVLYILTLLVLVAGIATVCLYAWFISLREVPGGINDGGFVKHKVSYYLSSEVVDGVPSGDLTPLEKTTTFIDPITLVEKNIYDDSKSIYILDGTNEQAFNYIGKLVIIYEIETKIDMRFRFLILDEWVVTRTYTDGIVTINSAANEYLDGVMPDRLTIYNKTNYFQRTADKRFYYDGLIEKGESYTIRILNGGKKYSASTSSYYSETAEVWIRVQMEAVQANRYSEVWNVEDDLY